MSISKEDITKVKGKGFLQNRGTECFSGRVVSIGGKFSAHQLKVIAECAEKFGLTIVMAVPHERAGGSFATAAYRGFEEPCLVEEISADLGIDIGNTLVGMHLKRVAVPVRLSLNKIGEANAVFARTRPKYIGGERARYC